MYVLKSNKHSKRYFDYTSKDVHARIHDHHTGSNKWTRQNGPFTLVYSEKFETKHEAIKREKYLKSGQGRRFLDEVLKP